MVANVRLLCYVMAFVCLTSSEAVAVLVTYDGNAPSRPTSVAGISINGNSYDVSITYNNNGATNPLRVGALPDADIPLARAGLLSLLNTQAVDSNLTVLFFQPNIDTFLPVSGQFELHGILIENSAGVNDWFDPMQANNQTPGPVNTSPSFGFVQFSNSSIPEPSAFLCFSLISVGLLVRKR